MTWMTYSEAADKLQIAPASVRQKARRGRWARRAGNDGLARIDVPDALLSVATSAPTPPATTGLTPLDTMRDRIAALEAEIAARPTTETVVQLQSRLTELIGDRDAWREQAQALAARQSVSWWRRLVG